MSSEIPAPPDPSSLDPLIAPWEAGKPLYRVHHHQFQATAFNPGKGRGRFHPFQSSENRPVPTLYAADSIDGALSETVFHAVPVRGPDRAIGRSKLLPLVYSVIEPMRELRLAALHGFGLRRLGVSRGELLESDAMSYQATVRWAAALHAAAQEIDGLEWVSRQLDTSRAVVLFGDRVRSKELRIKGGPLPLGLGRGFEEVLRAAELAAIRVNH